MFASTLSRAAGLALLAALSGCTLLVQGTSQSVTFTSEPSGATFTVAGQTAVTPVTLEIPKDDYQISFRHDGYEDAQYELRRGVSNWFIGSCLMGAIAATIDLASGAYKEFETTDVKVTLQARPDTVQELPVTVASQPPGADISIAGRSYGVTPKELRLPWQPKEREKEVTLRLQGYAPKPVALARSQRQLDATLDPLPVPVTVKFSSKPESAELRIDGRLQGKTPLPVDFLWKKDDKPRVAEWTLPGYKVEKRDITRDTKDLSVDLQEIVEEIVLPLKIEPAGAKVVVDGVALADGQKQVKLAWSISKTKHTVVLSQPGYKTRTLEVIRAGAAGPLEVRLTPALPGNQ
jgi:hypothetical protein